MRKLYCSKKTTYFEWKKRLLFHIWCKKSPFHYLNEFKFCFRGKSDVQIVSPGHPLEPSSSTNDVNQEQEKKKSGS